MKYTPCKNLWNMKNRIHAQEIQIIDLLQPDAASSLINRAKTERSMKPNNVTRSSSKKSSNGKESWQQSKISAAKPLDKGDIITKLT